jgi:hypothetical protein
VSGLSGPGLALAGLLSLAACGYRTGSAMPGGVREIAVEVATNDTRYRQLEIAYTRRLSEELRRRAQVRIADPGRAEAILRTRIVQVGRRSLVQRDLDVILEEGVLASIEVSLVDARTGEPLIAPFQMAGRAEAIELRGENLDTSLQEVMEELAERAVDRLEGEAWARRRGGGRPEGDAVSPRPAPAPR